MSLETKARLITAAIIAALIGTFIGGAVIGSYLSRRPQIEQGSWSPIVTATYREC
jgi:hypothetical protein